MTAKFLYFTADTAPTATELAEIARLASICEPNLEYGVRNAVKDGKYGSNAEPCDYVAGSVPSDFSGETEYDIVNADYPLAFNLYCQVATVAAASTLTLVPVIIEGTNAINLSDTQLAVDAAELAWDNGGADSVATVVDGVITGVGAGTATITATYTYDTGKTVTATFEVTVTS